MGRAPCCDKANVKKGPWSPEEDSKLKDFIDKHGSGGNWISLPHKAGLKRCGKSCRLRWLNYLRPNIKHGEFTDDEDRIICSLFASIGSRWSIIAARLPGRTDNDIKNYWNTKLKKKLMGMMVSSSQLKPPSLPFPSFLQTASSPSTSTYKGSNSIYYPLKKSFTDLEHPLSNSSNLFNSSKTTTAINTFLLSQESLVSPIQQYQGMKDNLLMFGGEPSSSSSDGSCNQISYGKDNEYEYGGSAGLSVGGEQKGLENNFYDGIGEKQKFMIGVGGIEFWGETASEDYDLEEIKQLASSNGYNNFYIDETKTQGKDMYYY